MKYFKNIEILYEKFYIIELSSDSDSCNEVYNINNINNRNNIVNNSRISDSEDCNIATTNVVNSSIGENGVNLSNFLHNELVNICNVVPFI